MGIAAIALVLATIPPLVKWRQHPQLKHGGFVPPLQVADQLSP